MSETIQESGILVASPAPGVRVVGLGDFAEGSLAIAGDGADEGWEEFVAKFHRHAAAWEGAMFLFLSEMFKDEDYLAIIDMGPAVVPLILRRLEAKPHWWMPALMRLTGEDPTEGQYRGELMKMREVWLEWARKRNLLSEECRR